MARRSRRRSSRREPKSSVGHDVVKAAAIWAIPESVQETVGKENADDLRDFLFSVLFPDNHRRDDQNEDDRTDELS